eukprot:9150299-Pyramimonas_sp.AAC.1
MPFARPARLTWRDWGPAANGVATDHRQALSAGLERLAARGGGLHDGRQVAVQGLAAHVLPGRQR